MITEKELSYLLKKDGIILNDVELVKVKTLLIELATIEFQSYIDKKTKINTSINDNNMLE